MGDLVVRGVVAEAGSSTSENVSDVGEGERAGEGGKIVSGFTLNTASRS
jgi:hypothetical protein